MVFKVKKFSIISSASLRATSKSELIKVIRNVWELDEIDPILNVGRRVIFNPKADLSRSEQQKIVNGVTGRLRREKTLKELVKAVLYWDYWIYGRVTQKKLKAVTGKNIKTIEKYYKELKDID